MCFNSRFVPEGIPGMTEFGVCVSCLLGRWGVVGLLVNGGFIEGGKGNSNDLRRFRVQILER